MLTARISKKSARSLAKKYLTAMYGGRVFYGVSTCGHLVEIALLAGGFPMFRARVNRLGKLFVYDTDYEGEPDRLRFTVNLLKRKPRACFVK